MGAREFESAVERRGGEQGSNERGMGTVDAVEEETSEKLASSSRGTGGQTGVPYAEVKLLLLLREVLTTLLFRKGFRSMELRSVKLAVERKGAEKGGELKIEGGDGHAEVGEL